MTNDEPASTLRKPTWIDRVRRVKFLDLFEKYRKRMVHTETQLPFDPTQSSDSPLTIERLAFETGWGMRLALKVFVPVCALFFVLTYALDWDFHGLIRSCSVAGMIGFGTNWIAIKMLFWPRESRPVFGHGLIPSQREQLIEKVADEVLEKLINEELISQKIEETRVVKRFSDALIEKLTVIVKEQEFKDDLRNMILTYVGDLASKPEFRDHLASRAETSLEEFAGTAFKGWLVQKLKQVWRRPLIEVLNREIEGLEETLDGALGQVDGVLVNFPKALEKRQEQIDHVLTTMLMGIVREVDVREIVLEQLSTVTADELEQGFRQFSDDKLSFITLIGGLLGLVGGTVLVWPLPSMGVLAALAVAMTVTDLVLYPLMRSRYWPRKGPRGKGPKAATVKAPSVKEQGRV